MVMEIAGHTSTAFKYDSGRKRERERERKRDKGEKDDDIKFLKQFPFYLLLGIVLLFHSQNNCL